MLIDYILGKEITQTSGELGGFSQEVKGYILGLKEIYDNLDEYQKALVPQTTLNKLTNSLSKIDKLEVDNLLSILYAIKILSN